MAFKSESLAANDAQRGEEAPAADEAGLPGRQPDLFDGKELVVVEDVAMNQGACLARSGIESIVTEVLEPRSADHASEAPEPVPGFSQIRQRERATKIRLARGVNAAEAQGGCHAKTHPILLRWAARELDHERKARQKNRR